MSIFKTKEEVTEEIIKANIQKYDNPNIKLNTMNPVTATVYTTSVKNLTSYSGTQTIEELIGDSSPVRFFKVKKFPIIITTEISAEITNTESDTIDGNMEILTQPNTLILKENDLVEFDHMKGTIFKVKNNNMSMILNNPYYKSTIEPYITSGDPLYFVVANQVLKSFTAKTKYDGRDLLILEDNNLLLIDTYKEIIEDLIEEYNATYYCSDSLSYIYENEDSYYYCRYLTEFLRDKNPLFTNINDSIFISEEIEREKNMVPNYKRSIFNKILKKKTLLDIDYVFNFEIPAINSWSRLQTSGVEVSTRLKDIIPSTTLELSKIDSGSLLDSILEKHYNDNYDFISDLEGYESEYSFDEYIKLPIIIELAKAAISKLEIDISDVNDKIIL